jgi:hypothetical protein
MKTPRDVALWGPFTGEQPLVALAALSLGPGFEKALSGLPNGIGRHEARWKLISRAGGGSTSWFTPYRCRYSDYSAEGTEDGAEDCKTA